MVKRKKITITGRVQGVGFRPAVYSIAKDLALSGFVLNDTKGVTIELQGPEGRIEQFLTRLRSPAEKPPLAQIKSCRTLEAPIIADEDDFLIKISDSKGSALSEVAPDIATCRKCLAELADKDDFRFRYPFINCTNCGPRYTIVKNIPYDRPNTTMNGFEMCGKCSGQYHDPADRRFHAQPVACAVCGPQIRLCDNKGETAVAASDQAVKETARMLREGKIVAIKGIGGFHLAVDALNEDAVQRLRRRKKRDEKPFAMMASSIEKIKEYAVVTEAAEKVLRSPQGPIVLLSKKDNTSKDNTSIAASVAQGVCTFGFMLCYAPLHYLIFEEDIEVLVMTSANISDEPLIRENDKAVAKLFDVADAFLMHNRDIYRQVDDSVVHMVCDEPVLLRRARGYVPEPVLVGWDSPENVFAAGADMKNTFCFAKAGQLITSEHIGDLEDAEVYHHYLDSIEQLRKLFEARPKIVACDLHPGYLSTQHASSLSAGQTIRIQHHWAHIGSVLAEYNLTGPVIGLECDGTGYGTDGKIWGCECLIASLESFERFGHLAYYPLPGGDLASKYPIRPILGLLTRTYGENINLSDFAWLLDRIEPEREKQNLILEQIHKNVNTIETSSLGRVFDAAAAMLGLGNCNNFEAQLPMSLEAIIQKGVDQQYDFEFIADCADEPALLDLRMTIKQMITDIRQKEFASLIAAKFHNTIAAALLEMAIKARNKTALGTVALSGGVFCNNYLINRLIKLLKKNDFSVLFNRIVPSNDGGISLGQAAIAAYKASKNAGYKK